MDMGHYPPDSGPADAGLAGYLSHADWVHLRNLGAPVRFEPRTVLFRQGEPGPDVYVIISGEVKVVRCEPDGGAAMLTIRYAGDVVGDMAALDGGLRSATVTTLTPLIAGRLSAERFRGFVSSAAVAAGFTRYTVARLREADEQRTELAVLPVRQRLARALIRLARRTGHDGGVVDVGLPQQDLAQLVGASRNAVVGELTWLRDAGLVATHRRKVILLNPAALEELATAGTDFGGCASR